MPKTTKAAEGTTRTAAKKPTAKGLKVERVFTTPGVHPYDEIEWESRDVVMTNWRDGSINFEQRGVEFPAFWSQNATQIVTSKYFRGALGTPQRETGLKQVIDRVVQAYHNAGEKHGYFATVEDAQIFADELTWLLLHQYFSFNSPVWFNVGTAAPQQVSACFILSVDDTMESILDWYKEEGMIFKGGSGAGVNLSKIRASSELLSSGGNASGPISFMRGADASAGTIKSGGATRRAAKMVILDVDHPDIEAFIDTKAREEDKIRALRDAGFDVDLGGEDMFSVQYQNANNSVRVTDTFMEAVENGTDYALAARKDGREISRRDARDVFRRMAQAAWESADPGIQYDGTIQDWHTSPKSGRISASNPCSEYVHLDDSSCNLASLNLMKFLGEDGSFDVERFVKTVEFVITAMEISISFADFPTEKIGQTTRDFRQLGIGYSNLGALLMTSGHAYDSEEGRALAAGITALMTGVSYRRSAEIAGAVGPYAGYELNAEPHQRVMAKHAAAAEEVVTFGDVDATVLEAAKAEWARGNELGAVNGWRNAQASVLAPTGTISFMMDCDTTGIEPDLALVKHKKLVGGGSMEIVNQSVPLALTRLGYNDDERDDIVEYIAEHGHVDGAPALREEHYSVFDCAMGERTISPMGHVNMMAAVQPFLSGAISKCVVADTLVASEDGLVRIGSMHRGEPEDTFRSERIRVASLGGEQKTDAFYYGGVRPTREVVLRSGQRIRGTFQHRLLTAGEEGLAWKYLAEIAEGDYVALQYGSDMWAQVPFDLRAFHPTEARWWDRRVTLPTEMTEELAFLLGAYASEGHTTESNYTVTITNSVPAVLDLVGTAWKSQFGLEARITSQEDKCPGVQVSSKTVVDFLKRLGCGTRAADKRIPDVVLRSPKHMVLAFLQGLALDAYTTAEPQGTWAICLASNGLLDDLQAVLANLGIRHGRISKYNKEYDRHYDEIYASGREAQELASLVPFLEPDKWESAQRLLARDRWQSTADVIPGISGPELFKLIPVGRSGRNGAGTGLRQQFRHLKDSRTKHVSRETVERLAAIPGVVLPDWLRQIVNDGLHFSPVAEVKDREDAEVFDLSVPEVHAFVANGIVNHNTVNVPESATVEDFEEIYFQGWKLGLKALAVYRDNCKVGQPLSAKKKEIDKAVEAAVEEVVATVAAHGPVRRKLPKKRPSQTISFSVGGAEGYMTSSSYPDDGLGEVFLKMSKQGSTLAGVMDALSVSISIALQYGVPLEKYVEKFTNMRFEPAGMTDDPDIRMASSLVDYIFRRLALDYLPYEERAALGILTTAERTAEVNGEDPSKVHEVDLDALRASAPIEEAVAERVQIESKKSRLDILNSAQARSADAPLCMNCGTKMRPAGSCYACEGCGATSGCS